MRWPQVVSMVSSAPAVEPEVETTVRLLPPYHVILENDDHHSMQFVMDVLVQVLGCAREEAYQLMLEAHTTGRAVIWTGAKEVAELKAEQVLTFHEPPFGPLGCHIEPAPSG